MKKLNPRETVILIITMVLIIFFIAYQFVIKPMHEGSADINKRQRVDRDRLIKASLMVAQKDFIEARYQNLVKLIGVVDSEEAQMPAIISKIEAAARES